jgi:hypothetical protein
LKFVFEGLPLVEKLRWKKILSSIAISPAPSWLGGWPRWRKALGGWRSWCSITGVLKRRDWGEIVYLMIQHEWMTSQDTDRIEDFDLVYDFPQVFERITKSKSNNLRVILAHHFQDNSFIVFFSLFKLFNFEIFVGCGTSADCKEVKIKTGAFNLANQGPSVVNPTAPAFCADRFAYRCQKGLSSGVSSAELNVLQLFC